jgi:hypothetical protein
VAWNKFGVLEILHSLLMDLTSDSQMLC